jgi:hypothetical protein
VLSGKGTCISLANSKVERPLDQGSGVVYGKICDAAVKANSIVVVRSVGQAIHSNKIANLIYSVAESGVQHRTDSVGSESNVAKTGVASWSRLQYPPDSARTPSLVQIVKILTNWLYP